MAFWTDPKSSPVKKNNFLVSVSGKTNWWWAQSVTKPGFDIEVNEYQLTNHKYKYPGLLTWNDVTITIVDPDATKAKELIKQIGAAGYVYPGDSAKEGLAKQFDTGGSNFIQIDQFSSQGKVIETWQLANCFVKSIQFGDLDYASDELVQITIVIAYDWAELKQESKLRPSIGTAGNSRPSPGDPPISSSPKNPEPTKQPTIKDKIALAGEGDYDYEIDLF